MTYPAEIAELVKALPEIADKMPLISPKEADILRRAAAALEEVGRENGQMITVIKEIVAVANSAGAYRNGISQASPAINKARTLLAAISAVGK